MGATIWLDVEGRSEADELPSDRSIMLRFEEPLDELATRLGVDPLTSFYDDSEAASELAEMLDEAGAAGIEVPLAKWSESMDMLATFAELHDHLVKHPDDLAIAFDASRAHWPAALLRELAGCRETLAEASAENRRVRLLLVG